MDRSALSHSLHNLVLGPFQHSSLLRRAAILALLKCAQTQSVCSPRVLVIETGTSPDKYRLVKSKNAIARNQHPNLGVV